RRIVSDRRFHLLSSAADKKRADIAFTGIGAFAGRRLRKIDRRARNLDFRQVRAACEMLDPVAIAVAGAEIERLVIRPFAENPIDMRDLLEPDAPFRIVDLTQAL